MDTKRQSHRISMTLIGMALIAHSAVGQSGTSTGQFQNHVASSRLDTVVSPEGIDPPAAPTTGGELTAEELKHLRPPPVLLPDSMDRVNPDASSSPHLDSGEAPSVPETPGRTIKRPSETSPPSPISQDQGEAGQKEVANNRTDPEATSWFSVQDLLPLAIVLLLILSLAWIIKRYKPAQAILGGGGVLEIVARLPISTKQTLLLVKIGRQLVLLGQSQDNISMLGSVSDPHEVSMIVGEVISRSPGSLSQEFKETFESEAYLYGRGDEDDPAEEARSHVQGLLSRVRQLTGMRDVA